MTWVKIDDQFQDHPKFVGASLATIGLWVAGLGYCNRYLTDGHIPTAAVAKIGGTKKLTDDLVRRGLWKPCEDGHQACLVYHDYLDIQESRDSVQRTRAARVDAGRKGGQARAKQMASNGQADAKQPPKQLAKQIASKPQARGASPTPLRQEGSGDEELSSSSQGVQGDDDDGKLPAARAAIDLLAARDLAEREARPGLRPIGDVDAWLDKARCRRWSEQGEQVRAMAAQGLDPAAIVAALSAPSPIDGPLGPEPEGGWPSQWPMCDRCGIKHLADRPCVAEPMADAR